MKKPTLASRARAVGLRPETVHKRKRAGWIDEDLLTPPQKPEHGNNKARPTSKAHPWKKWNPGRFSRRDRQERGS